MTSGTFTRHIYFYYIYGHNGKTKKDGNVRALASSCLMEKKRENGTEHENENERKSKSEKARQVNVALSVSARCRVYRIDVCVSECISHDKTINENDIDKSNVGPKYAPRTRISCNK